MRNSRNPTESRVATFLVLNTSRKEKECTYRPGGGSQGHLWEQRLAWSVFKSSVNDKSAQLPLIVQKWEEAPDAGTAILTFHLSVTHVKTVFIIVSSFFRGQLRRLRHLLG